MKKIAGIILKVLLGLILLILILLFTVPVIFKNKIRTKVEQVINESVNAQVKFDDYSLGFFKNFPNLAFSLKGVSVVGLYKFAGDTLAGFRSFDLVFNLSSLLKKTGYEVKSIILDQAVINAIVLKDGSANWDISKETTTAKPAAQPAAAETAAAAPSGFKVQLKKFVIRNSSLSYVDQEANMSAYLKDFNFNLTGNMAASTTDLDMTLNIARVDFLMDGVKYINKAVIDSKIGLLADLDKYKFTFRDNYFALNDLKLNFSGMVAMPGDNIETDLQFGTDQTSFKTLLSLVPAIYMTDFADLKTSGEFTLKGSAKGIYSDADSTLPDVNLSLAVKNGSISYPALPEKITSININSVVNVNGKNMDLTTANVDLFHLELAGNPFNMTFALKTPISDPDFTGSVKGKIDLDALSKAIPLDSMKLSGIINMAIKMGGKLSMIEKGQYDRFQASGTMDIRNMLVAMVGYPEVMINEADFEFSPAYAAMTKGNIKVGDKSDFNITGRLENYIQYIFKNETIKGNLNLTSNLVDASDILSKIATDTTAAVEDTTSMSLIKVPENIDFNFNAQINDFTYDKIKAKDVRGNIIVKNGVLSLRETGMNILEGLITVNADYDTRDTLKPFMKADFKMQNIGIKDAFNTFNIVQRLAPAAKGIEGKMNLNLAFESLMGNDMMPVMKSILGGGKVQANEVTLVDSKAYNTMKGVLKLSDNYSNTFKDINASFKIKDGRVYVSPFDTKVGNIKMNVSGDQGLDQTLNYLVKTQIPRSDLGNSVNALIDNLSAQAAAFGIKYKPADVLKVNVKITGVFGKPVVMPDFGGSSTDTTSTSIKSVVKETVKETVNQAVDTGKEKARQEAEAQGDRLIAEAETRAQQIRDEAAAGADKIRKEADEKAQKLIDEASSKGPIAKLAAQKGADALRNEADKKANALVQEADEKATKLVDDAKAKKEDLINKIQ
jgi:vacuolar-type H+-ATPase subunit H